MVKKRVRTALPIAPAAPVTAPAQSPAKRHKLEWAGFIVSLATLITLVFYTVYTHGQLSESRRANAQTERNTRTSLEQASRPWLTVKDIHTTLVPGTERIQSVSVSLENSGRTPAIGRLSQRAILLPPIEVRGWQPLEPSPLDPDRRFVIGPSHSHDAPVDLPSALSAQWDAVAAGRLHLAIKGLVEYEDGFGQLRRTSYCDTYNSKTLHWDQCSQGNSAE